jgi:hypothetical protein
VLKGDERMLYFLGYYENGGYTANFNNAVTSELKRLNISFVRLVPYDWANPDISIEFCNNINSSDDDVWLIGWAQIPLIEVINNKRGKKFGVVVGTVTNPYEPAVLMKHSINERFRLGIYHKLFVVSDWCKELLIDAYPEMKDKIVTTGFPIDFNIYDSYKTVPKQPNLVVFNQRFAVDKLQVIEIELSRKLIKAGYKVYHLSEHTRDSLAYQNAVTGSLIDLMQDLGIEFIYNSTKEAYYEKLAKAAFVVTTSISDMLPNSMLEAVYMGAVPIAPRYLSFPEFIHPDNLYSPYDLREMLDLIEQKPLREHNIMKYSKDVVIERYLKEMCVL